MSVQYHVLLRCDHAPEVDHLGRPMRRCLEETVGAVGSPSPPPAAEAREEAADDGWVRKFAPSSCGYDLCPAHAGERPGVSFPDWRKG